MLPVETGAGPETGDPAIRWSVGSWELTDQGSDAGWTHEDGSRTCLGAVSSISASGSRSSRGSTRCSSVLGECGLAQERILRFVGCSGGGGDEETRTPDPLLAKEMLCQLSYVPAGRMVAEEGGGRFWTRTRDLCLIRAVL